MKIKHKFQLILSMRCLLFIAVSVLCSRMTRKSLTDITNWWSVLASAVNIVTIFVLWVICRHSNTTYRKMIRFEKGQKGFFYGALFIAAMLLAGMGGMYLAGWLCYGMFPYFAPEMIAPIPPYLAVINIFILPLTTTIAEDGLYLGYGVNSFSSKWAAVLIPAFFYALQHSFIPAMPDMRFMAYRFLSFLPLTIWICFQYRRRNSISYIMAGHWILNMATTVQIAITSFYPEVYMSMMEKLNLLEY